MKILLTEEEYRALNETKTLREIAQTGKLQELCSLAAIHIPVKKDWHHEESMKFSPWGCILDRDSDPGYCDDCPMTEVCPFPNKRWSK